MANGDITTILEDLSAGASNTRQPSAGVEERVMHLGNEEQNAGIAPNQVPESQMGHYDGTNLSRIEDGGNSGLGATIWFRAKHFINNTNYLQYTNADSGTRSVAVGFIVVG